MPSRRGRAYQPNCGRLLDRDVPGCVWKQMVFILRCPDPNDCTVGGVVHAEWVGIDNENDQVS